VLSGRRQRSIYQAEHPSSGIVGPLGTTAPWKKRFRLVNGVGAFQPRCTWAFLNWPFVSQISLKGALPPWSTRWLPGSDCWCPLAPKRRSLDVHAWLRPKPHTDREVSSSAPHFLPSGLSINPINWRCLRRVWKKIPTYWIKMLGWHTWFSNLLRAAWSGDRILMGGRRHNVPHMASKAMRYALLPTQCLLGHFWGQTGWEVALTLWRRTFFKFLHTLYLKCE
jgi:hypothetical protein